MITIRLTVGQTQNNHQNNDQKYYVDRNRLFVLMINIHGAMLF